MSRFNLSALAVRERSITLFLIVAIILSGAYAFLRLGRAEDPTFVIKTLTVTAVWPGATARQMQDLVAEPLEKRMQELRWYDRVETFTRPGIAVMMVTLSDKTPASAVAEEFYQARKKLGDEAPKLPAGVQGPFVNDEYSDVIFAVYGLEAHGMPPRELTREAERLRQRLLHVSGVKKVNIQGERPERIFVDFSYARLANLGVAPRDIFSALQRQNAVTPAGSIDTNGPQVFMRLDGAYDDLQKIRDTPIAAGGRTLRLADIAEVKRGYEDPPTFLIRHDAEAALVLGVVMQDGWNGLDLGQALNAEEKQIAGTLPAGVRFTKVVDQAVNIREAVGEFMLKFFVALGVIMIVSLMSLGWRVGIVVAAAVPLTLAAVFVVMLLTGRLRLESHRSSDALGDIGHDHWVHARRFRALDRGRVRRQHLLDSGLCFDRVLAGGRRLHTVSRCQADSRHRARAGRAHWELFNTALSATASPHRLGRGPQVQGRGHGRRGVPAGGTRNGFRQASVLPELRSARGAGRSADARGDQHRGDHGRRH